MGFILAEHGIHHAFVNQNRFRCCWWRENQFPAWIGFAHGFLVLSETAEFCYKCDDFYHPNDEGGLAWNDPEIGITWPKVVGEYRGTASAGGYSFDSMALILSEKDQKWMGLKETFRF